MSIFFLIQISTYKIDISAEKNYDYFAKSQTLSQFKLVNCRTNEATERASGIELTYVLGKRPQY